MDRHTHTCTTSLSVSSCEFTLGANSTAEQLFYPSDIQTKVFVRYKSEVSFVANETLAFECCYHGDMVPCTL